MHDLLRPAYPGVNHKRVYRLYGEANRAVPKREKVRRPSAERTPLNIIRLRGQHGWSREALALEAGRHGTFVAHAERQARNISLDDIEKPAMAPGQAAVAAGDPRLGAYCLATICSRISL